MHSAIFADAAYIMAKINYVRRYNSGNSGVNIGINYNEASVNTKNITNSKLASHTRLINHSNTVIRFYIMNLIHY